MSFKDILKEKFNNKSEMMKLFLNKNFISWIQQETNFLDTYYKNIPNRIRCYAVVNDINENNIPTCICGKPCCLNLTYPEHGFRKYCGPKCSRKNKTINKDSKNKLENYNWLFNERIVNKKSLKLIAKELNISEFTVTKYVKKHKLDYIDSRRKNSKANNILESKEKLSELYENHSSEDIALLIGSSKATVCRWLNFHDIEIKTPNEYPRKNSFISKEEQELTEYIKNELNIDCFTSDRTLLKGKEIDIFIPNYNLAIEYNGLYSHIYRPWETKESKIKNSKYHLFKTIECEKLGIQLIHIFSDEWEFKQEIVKSILRAKLNKCEKIYARKTQLKHISTHSKNTFLDHNHIQGEDKSLIKLGLFYENEIVAVMTFCKSRFNSNYKWELSRYACKLNTTVVGGFSKLLNHFKTNYSSSIVSYADRRLSNGNVYLKNGFKLLHINKPSYQYVDRKTYTIRENRMKFQKKFILPKDKQTEYERARELGYEKIYDCGTIAFGLQ